MSAMRLILAFAVAAAALPAAAASSTDEAPPWFAGGRPGAQAQVALQLLAQAAGHGLEPGDYGLPALQSAFADAQRGAPLPTAAADRLQQALTLALQRYLQDLRNGRVAPAQIHHHFTPARREPFDAGAALQRALALQDLPGAVRQAAPVLPQYDRLRDALAQYRALAAHAAWQQRLPPLPVAARGRIVAVEPGQDWPGLPLLAARLAALGDLEPDAAAATSAAALPLPSPSHLPYSDPLVAAVRAFQQRHGLDADGVIGRATWAALQVAPAQRARQIELMLERLRWTPLLQGARMIVVNIPEFTLRAYEVQGGQIAVRAEMKVIVGRAMRTRTPLFDEDLRSIEFQPFWNVPRSIALAELVPRLRRDPGHWAQEGFEFVDPGGRADPVLGESKLQAVLAGQLRIRQRPGPRNALGDIKFVFPNRDAIYLHHTPSRQLFERSRRDFSHGCIRVEQPVALARFALQGLPGWDEPRIRQAMTQQAPSALALPQPVPVLITYGTTLVKGGRVHFFDDIYGHDRALDAALRQPRRPAIDVPVRPPPPAPPT